MNGLDRRTLLKGAIAAIGYAGLTRAIAACTATAQGTPDDSLGNNGGGNGPTTPPNDGDEYVPGQPDAGTTVQQQQAPSLPNKSWEARAKQLEQSGQVYTEANPGQWAGKERSHVPQVTVAGNQVTVLVAHVMQTATMPADGGPLDGSADAGDAGGIGPGGGTNDGGGTASDAGDGGGTGGGANVTHYITTIYIRTDTDVVAGLYEFASTDPAPPSITFTLPAGVKSITAYENCNIHGLWATKVIPVAT